MQCESAKRVGGSKRDRYTCDQLDDRGAKLLKAERPQPTGADPIPSLDQSLVGPEDDLSGRATEPVDSVVKSAPIHSTAEAAAVVSPSNDAVAPQPKAASNLPVAASVSRVIADRDYESSAVASLTEIATKLPRAEAAAKARTVNKVTWAQVGRVTEPGRYMLRFGWVTITTEDLAIWQQHPDAVFTLYTTLSAIGTEEKVGEEFHLGIVDLRENWNVPQNEK